MVKVTDESGVITDYTYDTKHRVKTLSNALGGVTENFYDTSHRVIRQDDAYDKRLRLSYGYDDGLNQETTITYPDGRIAIESYQDGALTQKTENLDTALEKRWSYSYDSDNQLISTVNPDGSNTGSVHDSQGNIVKYRNELGGESTFTYDSMGNILTATNPLGKATMNTYDVRGNITSATDPMGNKTSYEWDSQGY